MRINTHALYQQGEFYIINGCSLGHFYEKNISHKYRLFFRTLLFKKMFLTNIGRSLGHFYKKIFSHKHRQIFGTILQIKKFSQIQATLQDTFIKNIFPTNIGRSLGHFYKKNFLTTINKNSHNYKKNFLTSIKKKFSLKYKKIFLQL